MDTAAIHYAVLRANEHWDGIVSAGLEAQADGVLALAHLPGRIDGKPVVIPNVSIESSGIAAGEHQELYVAHTMHNRIIGLDGLCNVRTMVPGAGTDSSTTSQFNQPRGLLLTNDSLFVADSGNGRIQILRLPSLELRAIWEGNFQTPILLANDSQDRIYVLDIGLNAILRFSSIGIPDSVYNTTLAQLLLGRKLISLAGNGRDKLYVLDANTNEIISIDVTNNSLIILQGDEKPQSPNAMAVYDNWLYVADSATGEIWVADCAAGTFVGILSDYRGPVSALACDASGSLYVKPGPDDTFYKFQAHQSYAASGNLVAGPFDAGSAAVWERVHAELDLPEGTQAALDIFTAETNMSVPTWDHSMRAAALDTLIATVTTPRRYLWLRVSMYSDDRRRTSPLLKQTQAETTAESYLRHLPAVYTRDDTSTHFLEHWLALFRAELGDLELEMNEMARYFDPLTAPESGLQWLASWLAFEPPSDLQGDQLRKALQGVHDLYNRRGTPLGLREFIELYSGVRPAIFEAFHDRHIWQLGYTSTLGFDTSLAAALPDGMIVPGHTLAEPQYFGLRGDYYDGIDFKTHYLSRTDSVLDLVADALTKPDPTNGSGKFSVRWTGQVMPRFSERYTFHINIDDGVRLWVDGIPLIDDVGKDIAQEFTGTIELIADRWYSIQVEYYGDYDHSRMQLSWSSRTQRKEIIPQSQLYSVRDETAQLELTPLEKQAGSLLIGHTVVGESGPLAKDDFGMPLFSETAHLFTVSLPAGALPGQAQREMLQRVIDAEKPAHTDYHLCFVEPRMRVGFQARLGIDSIVASPPPPMELSGATLGLDSYLGEEETQTSRVGQRARLGQDTRIG